MDSRVVEDRKLESSERAKGKRARAGGRRKGAYA
jgi:hypothetical protein